MSLDEARLLARLWERSQWLYENEYRAFIEDRNDSGSSGELAAVRVDSPKGGSYQVCIPKTALDYLLSLGSGLNAQIGLGDKEEQDLLCRLGRELFTLLTDGQENLNIASVGSCTCTFWRVHTGKYWCKHYLGLALLIVRQQEESVRAALVLASRITDAVRCGSTAQS